MKNYISKLTLLLFFTFVSGGIQIVVGQETINKEDQTTQTTQTTTTNEDGIEYECFACTALYSSFEPIVDQGPIPFTFTIKLPAGGKVNLGGRYADADLLEYQGYGCPLSVLIGIPIPIQCIGLNGHSVEFSITEGANKASFDADDAAIDEILKNSLRITNYGEYRRLFNRDFGVFQSENAELFTSPQWNQGDIKVEITIIDNAPDPVPPINGDFVINGNCRDPELKLHTFTIERDNNIPTEIGLLENSPMDDTWVDMLHIINNQRSYFEEYFYRPLESCEEDGNGYEGHIITESFLNAVPLFTLNDLSEEWRISEEIMTADQAALRIFPKSLVPPPAASFSVENGMISDFHGFNSPFAIEFIRDEIFDEGATAIANNIIGYRLNQEYRTADAAATLLGTASIDRAARLNLLGQPSWFIKKTHTNICIP